MVERPDGGEKGGRKNVGLEHLEVPPGERGESADDEGKDEELYALRRLQHLAAGMVDKKKEKHEDSVLDHRKRHRSQGSQCRRRPRGHGSQEDRTADEHEQKVGQRDVHGSRSSGKVPNGG
jgi:hypothetical protein